MSTQIQSILNSMTLEQKVGQLFVLAFPGKDPSVCFPIIDSYGLGGCYISQENAQSFAEADKLSASLQERVLQQNKNLPLFLGVDQEGVWGVLIPEAVIGPGNLALGMADSTKDTYDMYSIFAQEMTSVGYQTILGPCSDVNNNPNNPIIGTRSFGEDPKKVSMHVEASVKALKDNGALATAKHFPGHGDTHSDTHRDIPVVDKPMDILLKNELLPFQTAINAGVDIMMTSHILYPQIDKEYPATLSPAILTDLLRNKMKFEGLIITDSMNMGAIRKHYSPQESSVKALLAGANFIMLSEEHYDHNKNYLEKQIASIEGVVEAVKNKVISEDVLNERVSRIIKYKLSLQASLKFAREKTIHSQVLSHSDKKSKELYAAHNAIRVLKNDNNIYPLSKDQSVYVINATPQSSYHNLVNVRGIGPNQETPAFDTFVTNFSKHYERVKVDNCSSYDENYCNTCDVIIVVTEDYPLPGEDFDKVEQQTFVQNMLNVYSKKLLVLGLRSPYELSRYKNIQAYMCTYSSRTCSAKVAAQILASPSEIDGIVWNK